ncbi:hypothetical protein DMB38_36005 [Streptomyces sp. WAC 06738]|nr:hypothetical protein DMB38_36005 [Streptomyces sp. WAC 06738]
MADWMVDIDEDRRIYLTLGKDDDDLDEDERRWMLGWIDTHGWFSLREPARGEALGDLLEDLPVPYMALPDEVAQAEPTCGAAPTATNRRGRNAPPPDGHRPRTTTPPRTAPKNPATGRRNWRPRCRPTWTTRPLATPDARRPDAAGGREFPGRYCGRTVLARYAEAGDRTRHMWPPQLYSIGTVGSPTAMISCR